MLLVSKTGLGRMFGGKKYGLWKVLHNYSRKDVQAGAARLRASGIRVRVVPNGKNSWLLYTRGDMKGNIS